MENTNEESIHGGIATINSTLVVQSTQKFFLSTELADVYFLFEIEQVRIPAHKYVLAMASETFRTMFFGSLPEDGDIKIVDSSSAAFKVFLSTLYCADVTITAEHVGKVMYLAKKYLVAGCLDICDQFLQGLETIDDIIGGYELAIAFNRVDLKKKLEEKISKQPKTVIESGAILTFSPEVLKEFLQIDGLMSNAKELFDVCMNWTENACNKSELDPTDMKNRKNVLGECLYWIPFNVMKPTEIAQIATDHKDLFDQDELIDLLRISASVGPVSLKKFKNKIDLHTESEAEMSLHEYKGRWVTQLPEEEKLWIKKQESVKLNYHNKRKLVSIRLAIIFHNEIAESEILSGILTIYQKDSEDEILLKQPVKIQCFQPHIYSAHERIKLIRPVEMTPGSHKFQIDFDSSWKNAKFFTKHMHAENEHLFKFLYYY